MKKNVILAIIAMAILATTVAVVSCKKETEPNAKQQADKAKEAFDMRKIGDINAYLKDFRQRMTESKDNETMATDEAAWHLACLANLDLCNASVEFNDVRFDTIEMDVPVTDGMVAMGDLRDAYERMLPEIRMFQDGLSLDNQNLRFVNMFISEKGNAKIAMMTTSTTVSRYIGDTLWYFPDEFGYYDSICNYYFVASQYHWKDVASGMLQTDLNAIEGRRIFSSQGSSCYFPTRSYCFDFRYWTDTFDSPFINNSRLCATLSPHTILSKDDMCYCLDSYLGLGYEYMNNNFYASNEVPAIWSVIATDSVFPYNNLRQYYHILSVQYVIPSIADPSHPDQ